MESTPFPFKDLRPYKLYANVLKASLGPFFHIPCTVWHAECHIQKQISLKWILFYPFYFQNPDLEFRFINMHERCLVEPVLISLCAL